VENASEKIIVITGGSDGLGKVMAADLSRDNRVIILSNNEENLRETAGELSCDYHVCDVRDYAWVEHVVNEIIAKHGRIDVFINNAGIYINGEIEANDPAHIRALIEINLIGVINCTKAIIPGMKNNNGGLIININSQGGITARPERSVYYASKWGVTGFTRCLQKDVSKYGIRVTDVMPGLMQTNFFTHSDSERDMTGSMNPTEVARTVRFVIETPSNIIIPEVGVRDISY
jgi:NADP-dependent 3-hydroxy acid dehydrogenase YdfG